MHIWLHQSSQKRVCIQTFCLDKKYTNKLYDSDRKQFYQEGLRQLMLGMKDTSSSFSNVERSLPEGKLFKKNFIWYTVYSPYIVLYTSQPKVDDLTQNHHRCISCKANRLQRGWVSANSCHTITCQKPLTKESTTRRSRQGSSPKQQLNWGITWCLNCHHLRLLVCACSNSMPRL